MKIKYRVLFLTVLVLGGGGLWHLNSVAPSEAPLISPAESAKKTQRTPASENSMQNSSVSVPKREPAVSAKEELIKKIHETKKCYASESCDYPHTDPKSYGIAVGKKLKDLLETYRVQYAKDVKNKKESEDLAREFMRSEDEFVQEVSIKMLADLAPSSENLKALTDGLQETLDPLLVEQGMKEMKRYIGTPEEPKVHQFLQTLLGHGSVFSSEKVVREIFPFINSKSYSAYEKVAHSLPANSHVGQSLRILLQEYRRIQSGG